jgi:hypothetical protein
VSSQLPDDADDESNHNLGDGGKNQKLNVKDGYFINATLERVVQSMYLAASPGAAQTLKGVRTILEERKPWPNDCPLPLAVARELLANQPDFSEQQEWLREIVESRGHIIDYYPKFHCECNFIERIWGLSKVYTRKNLSNGDFKTLVSMVPEALASVKLPAIRRFARGAYRFIHLYSLGEKNLDARRARWIHHRFSSHRECPINILRHLEDYEKAHPGPPK